MKVKIIKTDYNGLQYFINQIGYENVLQIIPEHSFDGTLFVVIYKEVAPLLMLGLCGKRDIKGKLLSIG